MRFNLMIFKYRFILLLTIQAFSEDLRFPAIKEGAVGAEGLNSNLYDKAFEIKKVSFPNGNIILHGVVYKPRGIGPFPSILFNHGSS